MKKIFAQVLLLLMVFSAVSCNPEKEDYSDLKGVLGLKAENMPEVGIFEVDERQQKTVNIKVAAESICGSTLTITLGVDPELVAAYNEANNTDYEMLPSDSYSFVDDEVMLPYFNTESSLGQINLIGRGCIENQVYVLPVVISSVTGSDNYEISAENNAIYLLFKMLPALKGTGTEDDPYLILEVDDILEMNDKLLSGEMIYFRMEEDIDMEADSEYFIPVNSTKPYDKIVHFDGQGHKISNLNTASGFFRVFFGSIENVIFENCTVNTSNSDRAIVADFFGYQDGETYTADKFKNNKVNNVVVRNSSNTSTGQRGAIFAGQAFYADFQNVFIENCDLVAARRSGLLVAKDIAPVTISNCYVKGGTLEGPQQMGGIIGENASASIVRNCGVSTIFNCSFGTGGIIGQCTGDLTFTVENCFVWGSQVSSYALQGDGAMHYSNGAIVGCMAGAGGTYKFRNCFYKPGYEFCDYFEMATTNVLTDMADIDGARVGTPSYNYPYHGKAAPAGKTASQLAADLGWNQDAWDLSGDEPVLKLAK